MINDEYIQHIFGLIKNQIESFTIIPAYMISYTTKGQVMYAVSNRTVL